MKLTLLGTGAPPPDPKRRGPSEVIEVGPSALLFDCGSGVAQRLVEAGIAGGHLQQVFITHLHSDHIIDLAQLLYCGWIMQWWQRPPPIAGPPGTRSFIERLLHAYEYDIEVRRRGEGLPLEALLPAIEEVEEGWIAEGDDWQVRAFRVNHEPVDEAFGYRIEAGGAAIVLSGDTRPSENLVRHAQGADLLLHEVYGREGAQRRRQGVTDPATLARWDLIDGYHTASDEVGRVAREAGAQRLVLNHVLLRGGSAQALQEEVERDYRGAVLGEDLMQFDAGPRLRS